MRRRTYLAVATASLAGCTGRTNESTSSNSQPASTSSYSQPASTDEAIRTGTFDDFGDLSAWSVRSGSLEADDSRGSIGSQSARLDADESTQQISIARELSEPIDCTSLSPGVTMTAAHSTTPTIQLFDASGDRIDFRRSIRSDVPVMPYNFGATRIAGDPDLSAITEIRIAVWAGDRSRRLWVDDLHFVPRPTTGKVMIQFDDGSETDYTEGFARLEEHGYPAVTFVNPGRFGNDGRLDLRQAERLHDAGWTIANHTWSHQHLEELDRDEQERAIVDAAEWLHDHGFEDGARYFAYPFGEHNETTLDIVGDHHDVAFWGGQGVHGYATNPLLCPRVGDPSAETAIELLDRAADLGGIVSLFYHELDDQLLPEFEAAIDRLHALESAGDLELILPVDIATEYAF